MIAAYEIAKRVLGNKYALGALFCLVVLSGIWIYGETRWRAGYATYETELAEGATEAERARVQDETRLKGLSDHDLCAGYLRSRGLPVEACQQLRGLPGERP
ncbi:hypothetical protein FIV06_15825 [Labrenzia sp. THAF191b]|uniref:hypothetical protein n=1 Tax=unclassified Labrenzia TaxID=2648686 RepID=UPI00126860A4|nr:MULTISPECIES: hypothetical protein [unclassified Labrenzia]QFS98897.1 hypothetical protein FIV06_15825 [Labrenzia sp. THAF191b]QFT05211.1 hypothetical protein FIV05_15820 [Labrenzia sp. THAF191a]QFT16755.1 hypothetical protein FIV03_15835 [Labrenzia sp. THAF187b]